MTYFGVLAVFIGPPLAILAVWAWLDARRGRVAGTGLVDRWTWRVLWAHVAIALIYTTSWDNYLVATEVWWYDEALVTGLTLGYVPIEEYTFFIVQTLLVGLWLLTLSRRVFVTPPTPRDRPGLRRGAALVTGVGWLSATAMLAAGWEPGTYMGLELTWALIPIGLQMAFGADILWARRGLVAAAILLPGVYLSVVDALAIQSGTWTIDPDQTTGLVVAGVLPVEEIVFFFVTTTLVAFGMTLMLAEESQERARRWLARGRAWVPVLRRRESHVAAIESDDRA